METSIPQSSNDRIQQQEIPIQIVNFKHLLLSIIGIAIFILMALYVQTTSDDIDGIQRSLLGKGENEICDQVPDDEITSRLQPWDDCKRGYFCYCGIPQVEEFVKKREACHCIRKPTETKGAYNSDKRRCRIIKKNYKKGDEQINNCPRSLFGRARLCVPTDVMNQCYRLPNPV